MARAANICRGTAPSRASRIKQSARAGSGFSDILPIRCLEEPRSRSAGAPNPARAVSCPRRPVTMGIAAARGGTLASNSLTVAASRQFTHRDLAQPIHDCEGPHACESSMKLVSSEGIGTIAVGVAKTGADVINVAGNTGGTGAASVTNLRATRAAPPRIGRRGTSGSVRKWITQQSHALRVGCAPDRSRRGDLPRCSAPTVSSSEPPH